MNKLYRLTLTLTVFTYLQASATDTLVIDSKITSATVYYKGATITRNLDSPPLGEHILAIKGIPQTIDKESITLEADDALEIKSVKTSQENSYTYDSLYLDGLSKSFKPITDSIELLTVLTEVLDEEYKMIAANQNFENDEEITSVEEVIIASEFYQSRVKKLKLEKMRLTRLMNHLQARKMTIERESSSYRQSLSTTEMVIYVHVNASRKNSELKLNYFSHRAKWSPFYDLKAGKDSDKIKLHRKAFVSQFTGEDWNEVDLSLSTASPTNRNSIPVLQPKRLESQVRRHRRQANLTNKNMTGIVISDTGEPIIGANVVVPQTNVGTVTDINGEFHLPAAINKKVVVSYIGHTACTFYINHHYNTITLKESSDILEEVVVTGSRIAYDKTTSGYTVDGVGPMRKEIQLEIKETLNSLLYELTDTYTVTSNSEAIDVLLTTENIPTLLKYESVPLETEEAFLFAEISDWHLYNLEPAPVNLFIDGTYKGKTRLNPDSQKEELRISLGSDPEVSLSRQWINDKYVQKFLSRHKEQTHHYTIKVKNNKEESIRINIKDLIPITSDEAIKIEPKELSGADLEEESGILTWDLQLKPGESKELKLEYRIKYPKNYDLSL